MMCFSSIRIKTKSNRDLSISIEIEITSRNLKQKILSQGSTNENNDAVFLANQDLN